MIHSSDSIIKPIFEQKYMAKWKVLSCLCAAGVLVGSLTSFNTSEAGNNMRQVTTLFSTESSTSHRRTQHLPVCENTLPYAKVHDQRPEEIHKYEVMTTNRINLGLSFDGYDHPPPPINVLPPGSNFCHWEQPLEPENKINPHAVASAWTADGVDAFDVTGENLQLWVPHAKYEYQAEKRILLKGNAVAFFGFNTGNYGHVLHDNMPIIAWLRTIAPADATFILQKTNMLHKIIEFVDPSFS
mmetsp:Transcript_6954/g.8808  ORF Transcript_6954/g.8808 Transcript_6954/m.8808 type:complete len:242 (-) Transcript_6954:791-1516(-)